MSLILVTRKYPYCANCDAAKRQLQRKGIEFQMVDISDLEHDGLTIRSIPALYEDRVDNANFLGGIDYVRTL